MKVNVFTYVPEFYVYVISKQVELTQYFLFLIPTIKTEVEGQPND